MEAERARPGDLVGRETPRRRLATALDSALAGQTRIVFVTGEAGIGKSTLVATITAAAAPDAIVGWGTCWGSGAAPGYWPWTQALSALAEGVGVKRAVKLASDDAALLGSLVPALRGSSGDEGGTNGQARFALFDAVGRWLARVAAIRPVVMVLDDLHWADTSSLELLDFVSRSLHSVPLLIVVAHRHDELEPSTHALLAGIAARSEHLKLSGLSAAEVRALVSELAGADLAARRGDEIHRRTGGHPLFVREVALLIDATGDETTAVPDAVREAITRRVARGDPSTRIMLEAAAVAGDELRLDVLAIVLDVESDVIARAIDDATAIGVVHTDHHLRIRFVHDLFRETLYDELSSARRIALHQKVAVALVRQDERQGGPAPVELARHFAAAVPLDGPERAVRWAFAAAAAESDASAFSEAAAHLARVRRALTDAGAAVSDATWTDLLVAEADALGRAGDPEAAKQLLAQARSHAQRCADGSHLAAVAFGTQRLGARFSMPRQDIVTILEEARRAVTDDRVTEAQLIAAMARELRHSVAEDRPRAAPLSEEALGLARQTRDPATLAVCLLARHDVLWTPGTAPERLALAGEIVDLATELGDDERRAEGLLLVANALLETGSPAFRPALATYLAAVDALGQPRHRYLALTRRGALALLDGRLDDAAALIDEAAAFGERIGEPDAGNVRMSQLLELIRARGDPDELRAFADDAVRWWVGAPVHAHAVAAGFLARADDLTAARRHVHTVLELGSWQADRSYLSSVFIGNLVTAAIALGDAELCGGLLDELRPIASSCGVNGAVVAFSGSHAHFAGLAAAALGQAAEATAFLDQAVEAHDRLGAATWEAESRAALGSIRGRMSTMVRQDASWNITYRHETVTVPDVKGLRDLATLLSRPGVDVHVLELVGTPLGDGASIEMADRMALAQYRQRLADLDDDRAEAERHRDPERHARAEAEHEALLDELRTVTGLGGAARVTGAHASERARKAVSARIKDAIHRLDTTMPQLAAHLDEAVVTGTWCRYRAELAETWSIEP